jgi:predicted nucleotidyltransferase
MNNRDHILRLLEQHGREFKDRFSVLKIGLFGSHARNEASQGSDIDLLVDFSNPTFDNYMDLKFYLEDLLQSPVDLVVADALKPRLVPYVSSEIIYA